LIGFEPPTPLAGMLPRVAGQMFERAALHQEGC
jgi:hypothetical protein